MRFVSPLGIGGWERKLLAWVFWIAPLLSIAGLGWLARQFDGDATVPKEYWDKLLSLAAISTLPIVGGAVLTIRARLVEGTSKRFGLAIISGAMVAFSIAVATIVVCIYFTVQTAAAAAKKPPVALNPGDFWVWEAALGAAITLGGAAVVVVATALNAIDDPSPPAS